MSVSGSRRSASAHSSRSTAAWPGKPSIPNWRHSTRLTLPSSIAVALAEGEGGNGGRRRAADAGQSAQLTGGIWPFSGVDRDNLARAAMEIARPGVIAESGPVLDHDLERRFRQRLQRRKARQETLEIRDHRADLRLLQHDLGEPDAVRVARLLPRQVVASGAFLPGDQSPGEGGSDGQIGGKIDGQISLDARMRSTDNTAFFRRHF